MKLDDVKRERSLLYMERYVDEGAKTYSVLASRTEAAPCYRPESEQASFDLVVVFVPPERVSVYEADCHSGLSRRYLTEEGVLFPIHPETWGSDEVPGLADIRTLPRAPAIHVAPTASTRTVLVLDADENIPAHFIKLHYPFYISRFKRKLRRKDIHNAVAATRELAFINSPRFAYLPEVMGVIFGAGEEAWGYLIREATAYPPIGGRFLIPCFALYAGDRRDPGQAPLLVQLIDHHQADPASFVVDEIIAPIIECWSKVVHECGLLLQSHAQNLLLEVDEKLTPRRIVHRDFDVWVDLAVRENAGLPNPFIDIDSRPDKVHPIDQFYSLIYDRFMGRGFFDYLLRLLSFHYGTKEEAIRKAVRDIFHRAFPDADRVFPAHTTYYFSDVPPPGRDFDLEDTGQAPTWR
ncbi:IucA/IucC family protein [Methylocystis iwaonis]|uniref:IucA/IucC family protein n=1 Tax=Methylocystis iwaonis TaxID=2885079 RepID=UPI002E7BA48D|nr:IucA/IucC family protein [Methylocystis iwaonis]